MHAESIDKVYMMSYINFYVFLSKKYTLRIIRRVYFLFQTLKHIWFFALYILFQSLFQYMCHLKNFLFSEFRSENLESDRKFRRSSVFGKRVPDRERKSGYSCKTSVDREYIRKVHLEGIVRLFPDFP